MTSVTYRPAYHAAAPETGYDAYLSGRPPGKCHLDNCSGFQPDLYNPDQWLPADARQWNERVTVLVKRLRDPNLVPCAGYLYMRDQSGIEHVSLDGIINQLAMEAGLPIDWIETDDPLHEGRVYWDIEQPDRAGTSPFGYLFVDPGVLAVPEALLYHGLNVQAGRCVIDVLNCGYDFIHRVLNRKHGAVLGATTTMGTNDKLVQAGINPFPVVADMLEHLRKEQWCDLWHPRVNGWA